MNVLTVQGSHYSCGQQIGTNLKEPIHGFLAGMKDHPPKHMKSWEDFVEASVPYRTITEQHFPLMIEELRGVADGVHIAYEDIFATLVEELWDEPSDTAGKACSDIIITPPRSSAVLIGHNNDLANEFADIIAPILRVYEDGTSLFTVGPCGYYVSVGVNSAGLVLTGNQLSPNDNRVGVPRAILARAILTAKTMAEAVSIATFPQRASSYNNILCTKDEVMNVEASATTHAFLVPVNNVLVHTNHFVAPEMLRFEAITQFSEYYHSSLACYQSLTEQASTLTGTVTTELLKQMLSSHYPEKTGSKNSVCFHAETEKTVFSIIIDMGTGVVELAMGNPCVVSYEKVWQIPQ